MNFEITEITFPSSDGKHTIYGEIYLPKDGNIRGVVQLAHGMCDYVGRYSYLAKAITDGGYAFSGHCHLGHGKSASSKDELGFFAERGGVEFLVEDMHRMNSLLRERFKNVPIIVMGHSMGSFIARIYAEEYPTDIDGLIIHGTGGPRSFISLGKLFIKAFGFVKGTKHRSSFFTKIALYTFNHRFPKEEGINAWLTHDKKITQQKLCDPYANFTFTLSAYDDLLTLVKRSNSKKWFDSYKTDLPTLIMSGNMDPVGKFGNGVRKVHKKLLKRNHAALTLKLYDGGRHELFNETNKEEVFSDILTWLGGVTE